VLGGRESLEVHAARLVERHQVQVELQAWVNEVLTKRNTGDELQQCGPDSDDGAGATQHHHHYQLPDADQEVVGADNDRYMVQDKMQVLTWSLLMRLPLCVVSIECC